MLALPSLLKIYLLTETQVWVLRAGDGDSVGIVAPGVLCKQLYHPAITTQLPGWSRLIRKEFAGGGSTVIHRVGGNYGPRGLLCLFAILVRLR